MDGLAGRARRQAAQAAEDRLTDGSGIRKRGSPAMVVVSDKDMSETGRGVGGGEWGPASGPRDASPTTDVPVTRGERGAAFEFTHVFGIFSSASGACARDAAQQMYRLRGAKACLVGISSTGKEPDDEDVQERAAILLAPAAPATTSDFKKLPRSKRGRMQANYKQEDLRSKDNYVDELIKYTLLTKFLRVLGFSTNDDTSDIRRGIESSICRCYLRPTMPATEETQPPRGRRRGTERAGHRAQTPVLRARLS